MDEVKYPKAAGVYKLTCIDNGKVYIGKSVNIRKRLRDHQRTNKAGFYFQNAILKHGWKSFDVEILEIFEDFDKLKDNIKLLERESYYIEFYNSTNKDKGYNRCKFSTDKTGIPMPESVKEKLRQANLGRKLSDEHKYKIGSTWRGKKRPEFTAEHKENISRGHIGKKLSDEHKRNIGKVNLGKVVTEETREKMSKSQIGKKRSVEVKEKLRNIKLGKPSNMLGHLHTEETKEKMRLVKIGKSSNMLGKTHSDETREKISQSKKGKPGNRKGCKLSEETKEKMRQSKSIKRMERQLANEGV